MLLCPFPQMAFKLSDFRDNETATSFVTRGSWGRLWRVFNPTRRWRHQGEQPCLMTAASTFGVLELLSTKHVSGTPPATTAHSTVLSTQTLDISMQMLHIRLLRSGLPRSSSSQGRAWSSLWGTCCCASLPFPLGTVHTLELLK